MGCFLQIVGLVLMFLSVSQKMIIGLDILTVICITLIYMILVLKERKHRVNVDTGTNAVLIAAGMVATTILIVKSI